MKRHRRLGPPVTMLSGFTGFRFPPEVILLAVRWYLRHGLSYRDFEELLAERGIEVDHVTLFRWVQHFTPYCLTPRGRVVMPPGTGVVREVQRFGDQARCEGGRSLMCELAPIHVRPRLRPHARSGASGVLRVLSAVRAVLPVGGARGAPRALRRCPPTLRASRAGPRR